MEKCNEFESYLKQAVANDVPLATMAVHMGCSVDVASRYLSELGLVRNISPRCKQAASIVTESYLRQAKLDGKSLTEMAAELNVSIVTISRYLKKFGLSRPNNLDISVEQVVMLYQSGMTGSEISQKLGISHDAVTRRLTKAGISLDRAEGIRRHFAHTYDERWPRAKELLDDNVSVSQVARIMQLRQDNLRSMMDAHNYVRPRMSNVALVDVKAAFATIIDNPDINPKRRRAAQKYLNGCISYFDKYGAIPRATQLAQHMDISVQTVSWWFESTGLVHVLSTVKYSYLVVAVCDLLDDMNIRYEMNRRDIIPPMEIDIWLCDFNTGIEINPVTTHSIDSDWGKHDVLYHQKKSLAALNVGIGFAHVYDFDLVDKSRWTSFQEWLKLVVSGVTETSVHVNLDRFLQGALSVGSVSAPDFVWVNPNTHECCCTGETDVMLARHFRRVFTAGFLDTTVND